MCLGLDTKIQKNEVKKMKTVHRQEGSASYIALEDNEIVYPYLVKDPHRDTFHATTEWRVSNRCEVSDNPVTPVPGMLVSIAGSTRAKVDAALIQFNLKTGDRLHGNNYIRFVVNGNEVE